MGSLPSNILELDPVELAGRDVGNGEALARWARRTASAGVCGSRSDRLNTEVPKNGRKGKALPHGEPCGLCHRLWFRSAQPQDAQESLLELQELLLAFMLFFCAVN